MRLAWESRGQGRPVVCLHGFGLDRTVMMAAMEPALGRRTGLHRIYLDLPGHGESPAGPPDSAGVVGVVHAFLSEMLGGEAAVLVGWSYGGYLAAGIARRWPGRVAGLLLVSSGVRIRPGSRDLPEPSPPGPPGWLDGVTADLRGHLDAALGHRTAAVAGRVAAALTAARPGDAEYQRRLRAHGYPLPEDTAGQPEAAADQAGAGASQARAGEVRAGQSSSGYAGPVCVLAGRQDGIGGYADQFRAMRDFPAGSYTVLNAAGHYLPLEQPGTFGALTLDWLDGLPPISSTSAGRDVRP
jgi:pimeloyl-ACP methyl ester carboxylesterase